MVSCSAREMDFHCPAGDNIPIIVGPGIGKGYGVLYVGRGDGRKSFPKRGNVPNDELFGGYRLAKGLLATGRPEYTITI